MKNKDEQWVNVERRQGTDLVSGFVILLLTPCCSSDKQRNRHFIRTPTYERHASCACANTFVLRKKL